MRLLIFFIKILSLVRGAAFLNGLTCSYYIHGVVVCSFQPSSSLILVLWV